jgi:hypothetical protein
MLYDPCDPQLAIPSIALVAAGVALLYSLVRFRRHRDEFGLVDAGILFIAMATGAAAAVPLVNVTQERANAVAMLGDLHILRTQIGRYTAEHDGHTPLLYKGDLPQLTHATNAAGVPGTPGTLFPYGPYLREGIPPNPFTGQSVVTAVPEFPAKASTGAGGWVYHQESGRIAPDQEGYLDR